MEILKELQEDFKEHKEEVKPLLELLRGAVVARRVILFFTSIILAFLAVWGSITTLFK